ncbi:MMPL family transporter [Streptomyces sp. ODS28]|uniref:MMPL family transporter n=1 Tax=Streptomyces sp. ODS28 TaxID=3136688 RepID=UPI0031EDD646
MHAVLYRRRALVLWISAVLMVLAAVGGFGVEHRLQHGGFTDPRAESARAEKVLSEQFPGADDDLVILLTGPGRERAKGIGAGGVDDARIRRVGADLTHRAQHDPGVRAATSYWTAGGAPELRSTDHRTGLIALSLRGNEDRQAKTAERLVPELRAHDGGLVLQAAGSAQVQAEVGKRTEHDLLLAEVLAAPVTTVLLLLVFGSAVAAALPLVIALLSILVTRAVLNALASAASVSVYSMNLTTALGLGLAIDYSLFVLARFREELRAGAEVPEALRRTLRSAGRTVAFSALTVALSLVALLVFPQFFLRSFAYGGIVVVLTAAAGAVLVLPALLAVLGHRVNRYDVFARWRRKAPVVPVASGFAPRTASEGRWYRFAHAVMKRPAIYGSAVVILLVLLASPFLQASPGLFDDRSLPAGSQVHRATERLREGFAPAATRAMPVVVEGVGGGDGVGGRDFAALDRYAAALSGVRGVRIVSGPTGDYAGGRHIPVTASSALQQRGGDVLFTVVSAAAPDDDATGALVHRVRALDPPTAAAGVGAAGDKVSVSVGGRAADIADSRAAIGRVTPAAVGIVVGSSLVLLFLFTGSVLMPVKALVLNVLSLSATFGAMVFVFQDGHLDLLVGSPPHTGHIDAAIPILTFCVAFGLSMDYEVFLLSRIRERYLQSRDNTEAVAYGLQRTGGIITAAAAIIAVVLVIFAISGVTLLKLLGVGLALAVILDATLVRAILVPSFMRLAGHVNWWAPGVLRRVHGRVGLREGGADEAGVGAGAGAEAGVASARGPARG